MKTFFIATLFMASFAIVTVKGQNNHFPVQVSFVYPIGTHGFKSNSIDFDFSLNMLTGFTGSIHGFEVGGLLNMNRGSVSGFQVAGLGNITKGSISGFQAAGIFGTGDSLNGMQVNGIMGNVGASYGVQVSGIVNISRDTRVGIAGLTNLNNGDVNGIQISGILNKTRNLNGVQLGLINIADSSAKGISIGLINIIRNRFFDELYIEFADYSNLSVGYHLGTKELYTIFSAGMNFAEDRLWVAGIGLGHVEKLGNAFTVRPEMLWYTYFPMAFESPLRDTWIWNLRLAFVRDLSPGFSISVAPGFYMAQKSNKGTEEDYGYNHSFIPPFFEVRRAGSSAKTSVGFGLALALMIR